MLTIKTFLGAGWSVSSRLLGRLIDIGTLLILARMLSPADFGLTALAMTLISIVDIVLEIPLTQALTRLRNVEKVHLDTAFTLGLLRGLLFSLVVIAAAWPFAKFYHDPRLAALIAVLSLGPIARGLYSPAMVRFIREMSFREVFLSQLLGKLAAVGAALLVLNLGGGYWAIVTNSVGASLGATLISYAFAPYRPAFSLAEMHQFSGFMGWFSASQLVSALNWQLDRVLLGHFTTKAELGRYTMAGDVASLPTASLIGPAMQPVMAAFSKINHDATRIRSAYLKASRFTMMLSVPVCLFMSLTSDLTTDLLLGPQWKAAGVYLQWLALTILPTAYFQPLSALAFAVGRPRTIFEINAVELCFRVVLVTIGLYYYSIWGAIAARGLVSVIIFVASLLSSRKLAHAGIAAQLANLWEVALASTAMAVAILVLRDLSAGWHLSDFFELSFIGAGAGLAYIGALFMLGVRIAAQMAPQR